MPYPITINFKTFEESFYEALSPQVSNNIILYKVTEDNVELLFSWDNFTIRTSVSINQIDTMFPQAQQDAEVQMSDIQEESSTVKFINHYTHGRGIKYE